MVLRCCIRTEIYLKLEHSLRKKNVRQVQNCKWWVLTALRLCIHTQIIFINLAKNKEVLAKVMAWYNFTDNVLVSIWLWTFFIRILNFT
jgi:hypothetical protein